MSPSMPISLERITAVEKPIADVFSDQFAFTIPPYQRPYAWERDQASELLDDLSDAMDPKICPEGLYFLGSIVLVKRPGSPEAKVVDGQQRLTTLTILFSVLRDLTVDGELLTDRDKYVKQASDLDRNRPERLRLHLRQRDQAFFKRVIQNRNATTQLPRLDNLEGSQARIVENASHYRDTLSGKTVDQRDALMRFMLNNCYLVVVSVPTDTAARRIFTVLNARGLDLTATDILKADLLERAGEQRERDLSVRWEEIELALNRERFTDLFTHIRMIFQREKPRSALEVGFPEFVQTFKGDPEEFMSNTLQPFADALTLVEDKRRLAQVFSANVANTAPLLDSLNRLDNKDWIPPLLLQIKRHSENEEVDVHDFVVRLERLAYFLFVTRSDVNTRMARYADVLDGIDPRRDRYPRSAGLDLSEEEISRFLDALDEPVYSKSRVVKPLLLRLDLALSDGSAIYDYPTISVEHVCPQSIASVGQWNCWFSDREAHRYWLHRVANLVLLNRRKNSKAGNWDFARKKEAYFAVGDASPFVLTREVDAVSEWTPGTLLARQETILRTFAKCWRLEAGFENWNSLRPVTLTPAPPS